ncbi:lectin 9-like [Rhododendron vialii]|uniref:lectin 9-like n=1 Tax=Rhododendron vialii TaxID=182163 RepID=UPI00265EA28C|nr:lectin 9-like [Rhododendron vialii]
MAIFNFQILLYSLSLSFCILFPQTTSLTFNLTNLGNQDQKANIKTFGAAYISPGGLQVTSNERSANLQQQVGKATYIDRLHLWDNSTGKLADFSTHFVFVIDSEGRPNFADGLAFFLAPDGSKITAGGAIGLPIDPITIVPTSPFVAVEFDTFQNGWDPVNVGRARHVGIDVNSLTSSVTAVWSCAHGRENEAWIRYDSSSYKLSVFFTGYNGYNSRMEGSIDFIVDLRNYLPEWVTIGFSASTGSYFEQNTVKSWEFSSSLEIDETKIIELELKNK